MSYSHNEAQTNYEKNKTKLGIESFYSVQERIKRKTNFRTNARIYILSSLADKRTDSALNARLEKNQNKI